MNYQEFRFNVGGREVVVETGKYAEQARVLPPARKLP